jgi:hypothetical protein
VTVRVVPFARGPADRITAVILTGPGAPRDRWLGCATWTPAQRLLIRLGEQGSPARGLFHSRDVARSQAGQRLCALVVFSLSTAHRTPQAFDARAHHCSPVTGRRRPRPLDRELLGDELRPVAACR